MTEPIDVVLFDMGGVLVELGELDQELGVDDMSSAEFWERWLASAAVRALERGHAGIDRFAEELVAEFELRLSTSEVIERFLALPRGLYPGAQEMLGSLPDGLRTGLLSNTNELHWQNQPEAGTISGLVDHNYLSFQLGLLKPDRAIFDHVVADLQTAADRVLFIDDNRINVDGARAAGLRSEVAQGPRQAVAVLSDYGLVAGAEDEPVGLSSD